MIRIHLSDVSNEFLIKSIKFANSLTSQNMAVHGRSGVCVSDEKLRGMFCEELTTFIKPFDIKRNPNKVTHLAPEFIDSKNRLWDLKITTRLTNPQSFHNCPYCKQNVEKDKNLYLAGYIVGTFKIPCESQERHNFTVEVFQNWNIDLLKRCEIIYSGWIYYDKFIKISKIILQGEDLNQGVGHFQPAQYDNYVCLIRDLNDFPLGGHQTTF